MSDSILALVEAGDCCTVSSAWPSDKVPAVGHRVDCKSIVLDEIELPLSVRVRSHDRSSIGMRKAGVVISTLLKDVQKTPSETP